MVVDGYFVPVLQENPLLCSIISTHLDRCGRLWILDSGLLNLDTFKCAAKIVIIDKNSEEILDIYEFPPEYSHPASRLIKMVVDENFKKCRDFKAVISDAVQKHLIVYEPAKERSWIVTSPTFENQSIFENVQFQDITFSFPVGVYSVAFTPAYGKNRERCLVYTIFSGDSIYCVPTSILYDYSLWSNGFSTRKLVSKKKTSRFSKFFKNKKADVDIEFVNVQDFFYFIGKTDIQLVGTCGIDKNWLMYCGAEGGVTVMNLRKGSEGNSFIVRNDTMEYVSDVHVVRNPQGEEELFALNNSMLVSFLYSLFYNCNYLLNLQRILGKPFNSTNMNYGYYGCKISEMNAGDNVKCNPFICSIR